MTLLTFHPPSYKQYHQRGSQIGECQWSQLNIHGMPEVEPTLAQNDACTCKAAMTRSFSHSWESGTPLEKEWSGTGN